LCILISAGFASSLLFSNILVRSLCPVLNFESTYFSTTFVSSSLFSNIFVRSLCPVLNFGFVVTVDFDTSVLSSKGPVLGFGSGIGAKVYSLGLGLNVGASSLLPLNISVLSFLVVVYVGFFTIGLNCGSSLLLLSNILVRNLCPVLNFESTFFSSTFFSSSFYSNMLVLRPAPPAEFLDIVLLLA